ncbi:CBS domain-containing protein [Pseudonocardia sp. NPDC049635]|uniref:CBS domain-containing protein n=1 Tax=Pseudonocardia sp. NPDC049635 TaxID=3155506 RepID=UPI0033CAD3A8
MTGAEKPVRFAAPPETLDDRPDPLLRQVMSDRLLAVTPATPVRTALEAMLAQDVHHLPVLDGHHCRGMATEADLLRGIAAQRSPLGWTVLRVADVHGPALLLPGTARLSEAARLMTDRGRDAVLVETGGRIRGIVTATDLVRRWRP